MTENEERNSESRYRQLFESAPVSLWEEDFSAVKKQLDGLRASNVEDLAYYLNERPAAERDLVSRIRVVDVNETTLRLYGADSKERFLSQVPTLFSEASYTNFRDDLLTIWEGGTHFSKEATHLTLNGTPLQVQVAWSVVAGYERGYEQVLVSVVDVGCFLSAGFVPAGRLREREAQYRQLYETMSQGVIYQEADGRISSLNPAAERILGISTDHVLGGSSHDPRWRMIREDGSEVPGPDHPAMVALESGEPVGPVVRGVFRPDLERYVWLKITAIPLFHPGANQAYQVYATFEDITAARAAGQERETAAKRAVAQRQALSELALNATVIDGSLLHNLQHITESVSMTLGVARASIWELTSNGEILECLDLYTAAEARHTQREDSDPIFVAEHPHYFEAMRERSQVFAHDGLNDPRTAELAESYLKPRNISSLLDSAIVVDGRIVGVMSCEHIGPQRSWAPDEEAFVSTVASLVAQLFENMEKQEAEEALRRQLEDKELLLRETHHRIKNNLSSICSLLSLQAQDSKHPQTVTALEDAAGRVGSMSRLYERMLLSDVAGEIPVHDYLHDLVTSVVEWYDPKPTEALDCRWCRCSPLSCKPSSIYSPFTALKLHFPFRCDWGQPGAPLASREPAGGSRRESR
ncbi:MAG: PAS domain-containing protein [Spirochaeta sp.]|nr:PAS domain-containing protein [Spirochaeta sp.]